jgi:taurine dioxygenase
MPGILSCSVQPFGVEVEFAAQEGTAWISDLAPGEKTELVDLYNRDGLLLVRGLSLSIEDQGTLCSVFGPVSPPDHPIISNVRPDGILGDYELRMHHDIPYVPVPYLGGALYALNVDEGVSATRFASGYLAYELLPAPLRQRVNTLNAIHVRARTQDRRTRLTDLLPGDPAAVQPVVGRHPITGRSYLFVDESMTAAIIGMSEGDSDRLLEELFSFLYADGNVYEHSWSHGDIVIWDNRAIQHGRRALTTPGTRTLQRVNIAALSYFEQCPSDFGSRDNLLNTRGGDGWSGETSDKGLGAPISQG